MVQRPKVRWKDLQKDYWITLHARERYLTRFMKNGKYYYLLKHGMNSSEQRVISLIYDLSYEMKNNREEIEEAMLERLDRAKENRSYLNDSEFLAALYERYGYQRYSFMVDDDVCFIVVPHRDTGQKTVVTCLYAKTSRHKMKKKFGKKESSLIL